MARERFTEGRVQAYIASERQRPFAVRDEAQPGLMLIVNKRSASWACQADLWRNKRLIKTVRVNLGRVEDVSLRDAREAAAENRRLIRRGVDPNAQRHGGSTLLEAAAEYVRTMERRRRSPRSIEGVRYCVENYLRKLHRHTLQEIGEAPREVRQLHVELTKRNGVYAANGAMRALRAIYNHELRVDYDLPPNPVTRAVEFNRETRRKAPFGSDELSAWWRAVSELDNPIRQIFHLIGLTTGSRPGALTTARREHLELERAVLHIPAPKGGDDRAFDIPLSAWQVQLMTELLKHGDRLKSGTPWLFPSATSQSGHLVEYKETGLATGHSLRHVYRTIAQEAGIDEIDVKLLLNHALGDVTSRYLTRAKLLEHLRAQQERITAHILRHAWRSYLQTN